MKGKMKSDIKVECSGEMKRYGIETGYRKCKYLKKIKINVKKNYRKIGKKNDNDVDADVTQLEHSNNKCYVSTFRYIYR